MQPFTIKNWQGTHFQFCDASTERPHPNHWSRHTFSPGEASSFLQILSAEQLQILRSRQDNTWGTTRGDQQQKLIQLLESNRLWVYQKNNTAIQKTDPDPDPEATAKKMYLDIRALLNTIVTQERCKAEKLDVEYQKKNYLQKFIAQETARATGMFEAGEDLGKWLIEVVEAGSTFFVLKRSIDTAIEMYLENNANDSGPLDIGELSVEYSRRLQEKQYKEMIDVLGFDPSTIEMDDFIAAWQLANILCDDKTTVEIITNFVKNYALAQHILTIHRAIGGAMFEIVLTILLAAFTGGAGGAANVVAKMRYARAFKKVGDKLWRLGKLLQRRAKAVKKRAIGKIEGKTPTVESDHSGDGGDAGESGTMRERGVAPDKLTAAQRIEKLDLEGHAPIRHGGPNRVTGQQLEDRAVKGIDPASGTRLDAFNKFPNGTPKPHKVGRNATAFASDEALLHADDFARSSTQFQQNIAAARANGDMFIDAVELPLKDVFGGSYQNSVRGVTRLGSKNNPTGHAPTDFTDGTIKAIYRLDQSGNVKLHTLYPNPKP